MADLLADLTTPHHLPGPRCGVARALGQLDEPTRDIIITALSSPTGNSRAIADALAERIEGPTPRWQTVARHMRGDCACPRPSDD